MLLVPMFTKSGMMMHSADYTADCRSAPSIIKYPRAGNNLVLLNCIYEAT